MTNPILAFWHFGSYCLSQDQKITHLLNLFSSQFRTLKFMDLPANLWIGVIYVLKLDIFESMQQSYTRAYRKETRCILIYWTKNIKKLHASHYRNCHIKLAKLPNFTTLIHQFQLELPIPTIFKVPIKGLKKVKTYKILVLLLKG